MIENIHWLGHDSFRLDGSSTVYIDPWKLSADAPPADLARLSTPRTTLIGPASVTAQVDGVAAVTLSAGETATVGGVTVTAVPAYNIDKFRQPGEVFHPRAAGGPRVEHFAGLAELVDVVGGDGGHGDAAQRRRLAGAERDRRDPVDLGGHGRRPDERRPRRGQAGDVVRAEVVVVIVRDEDEVGRRSVGGELPGIDVDRAGTVEAERIVAKPVDVLDHGRLPRSVPSGWYPMPGKRRAGHRAPSTAPMAGPVRSSES